MKKISVFSFCFLFFLNLANAQLTVPQALIGEWFNDQSNWEYGFFEQFAVYESEFWEYEEIEAGKKLIEIRLKNGNEQVSLKITPPKSGQLTISRNNEKPVKFKLHKAGIFPYTSPETSTFKNSGFQQDTVTIIGYYRNLDKYHEKSGRGHNNPFKVSVPNFILDKSIEYFADIDSLGRFEIKFPVLNTQEIYIDWGRLTHQNVVEPGETLFLFADMADFIPTESERNMGREGYKAFNKRPKKIIFMGEEARVHNELALYMKSTDHFDKSEVVKSGVTDMEFLTAANSNYKARVKHLESYIESQPALSKRFRDYTFAYEKYQLAFHLMQHRFDKYSSKEIAFDDDGYMEFVNATMDFNEQQLFTLVREYSTFTRDYVGYYNDLKNVKVDEKTGELIFSFVSVRSDEVFDDLRSEGYFNEQDEKILDEFKKFQAIVSSEQASERDSLATAKIIQSHLVTYKKVIEDFNALAERPDVKLELEQRTRSLFISKRIEASLNTIDSLLENNELKDLTIARVFYSLIEDTQNPLSADLLTLLHQKISNVPVRNFVMNAHQHYVDLEKRDVSYEASLKNTDHLKEAKDADSLFSQLIAPYKGKVIYLDFWGTWCGPCREQMKYTPAVKKELAGKEVVFMYLANRSPEKSWMNVIKEMELSGENVVHFRLPDAQQAMIERKLSVQSFPTYMLIDQEGKIVNDKAPRPQQKDLLVKAIDELLTR